MAKVCKTLCVICWLKIAHVSVQPTMHTGVVSPHASGLTTSIAHARSLSAMELQNAVAEAQSLAVQAAEAQTRVQQVAQVSGACSLCSCRRVLRSSSILLQLLRHECKGTALVKSLTPPGTRLQAHAQAEAQVMAAASMHPEAEQQSEPTLHQAPSLASHMATAQSMQHSSLSSHPGPLHSQPQASRHLVRGRIPSA